MISNRSGRARCTRERVPVASSVTLWAGGTSIWEVARVAAPVRRFM
jgi:hypothetical protein